MRGPDKNGAMGDNLMTLHPSRTLSVFAFDPAVAGQHQNRRIKTLKLTLPWEMEPLDEAQPFIGPQGDYVEVVDFDAPSGVFYDPIDLNSPHVRLNDGLTPSVDNPQFHQQMVYAVSMNTIAVFEKALGRVALWAPTSWNRALTDDPGPLDKNKGFVQRLRIYPHALLEANAYYDSQKKALLFGYFQAGPENAKILPGTTIFTCLSHDIIVHETCHALLDGMHPYFSEPSNPDVLALHEAFSDIVAILQHFSHPEVLEDQIAKTRGDLERQSLLGALAQEFGQALGRGHALRDALGEMVKGEWQPKQPDNRALDKTQESHARGSILVAAIFRAYLNIYKSRIADLLRIASGGRGILPEGELDPDLKRRLAQEAAKSARHLLQMCIRALDYCPPVDVTFGDYLRALITADYDLYPCDAHGYRAVLIEAFTAWGIRPNGMQIVTEQTLIWPTLAEASSDTNMDQEGFTENFGTLLNNPSDRNQQIDSAASAADADGDKMIEVLDKLATTIKGAVREDARSGAQHDTAKPLGSVSEEVVLSRNLLALGLAADRKVEFLVRHFYGELFWGMIHNARHKNLYDLIGIDLKKTAPKTINRSKYTKKPALQVHSVRMANRIGDRGQIEREYVVELVQSRAGYFDPKDQEKADSGTLEKPHDFAARSGTTLLIDARSFQIRRIIRTDGIVSEARVLERHRAYRSRQSSMPSNAFDGLGNTPQEGMAFAALHRHSDEGSLS